MDKTVRKDLKKDIKDVIKQHEFCYYCGKRLNAQNSTIDHVIPVVKGGTNDESNLVHCCSECNTIKGGNTIGEIITILKNKLKWCGDTDAEKMRRCKYEYYIQIFTIANNKRRK